MNEQWVQWKPIKGLLAKYSLDSILYGTHDINIALTEFDFEKPEGFEAQKILVSFNRSTVHSCRNTYETFRWKLINDLSDHHSGTFFGRWTFFKIAHSSHLEWFSRQAKDATTLDNLMHLVILGENQVLDIIASAEPMVSIVEQHPPKNKQEVYG